VVSCHLTTVELGHVIQPVYWTLAQGSSDRKEQRVREIEAWWPVVGTGTARSRRPPPRAYGRSRGGGRERPSVERSRTRPGSSRSATRRCQQNRRLRARAAASPAIDGPTPAANCVPMTGSTAPPEPA